MTPVFSYAEYLDLKQKCDKHHRDLYEGEGRDNPSLTTRMQIMEENFAKQNNHLVWLLRTVVATFLIVLGDMVFRVHR